MRVQEKNISMRRIGVAIIIIAMMFQLMPDTVSAASKESQYKEVMNRLIEQAAPASQRASMTKTEIALALHDALVVHTEYDTTMKRKEKGTIYGALVERKAVCEGYTNAYKAMLNAVGIDARYVLSKFDKTHVAHAYVMVKTEHGWYNTDPTWGDPISVSGSSYPNRASHQYFMKTDEEFIKNANVPEYHTPYDSSGLPKTETKPHPNSNFWNTSYREAYHYYSGKWYYNSYNEGLYVTPYGTRKNPKKITDEISGPVRQNNRLFFYEYSNTYSNHGKFMVYTMNNDRIGEVKNAIPDGYYPSSIDAPGDNTVVMHISKLSGGGKTKIIYKIDPNDFVFTKYQVSASVVDLSGNVDNSLGAIKGLNANGYERGRDVTLTAVPKEGSQFIQWDVKNAPGSYSTNPVLKFPMTEKPITVKAIFQSVPQYQLTIKNTKGGAVKGGKTSKYNVGKQLTLVAEPDDGYKFVKWNVSGLGSTSYTNGTLNITMPSNDVTVEPEFAKLPADHKYSFKVDVDHYSHGSISGMKSGGFVLGKEINVKAEPKTGYKFVKWEAKGITLKDPTAAKITFYMPGKSVELKAIFESKRSYSVTSANTKHGTVTGTKAGQYGKDTTIEAKAQPKAGYRFQKWEVKGVSLKNIKAANTSFSMPNNDVTLRAVFEPIPSTKQAKGNLDVVNKNEISGWAYNPSNIHVNIFSHIYVLDKNEKQVGLYNPVADIFRQDLLNAKIGSGNYGFKHKMDWRKYKPGKYLVRAFAYDPTRNDHPVIGEKYFTVRPIVGNLDQVSKNGISGWCYKPDAYKYAIQTHIYIYDSNNNRVGLIGLDANNDRPDVKNAGFGTGKYGFQTAIDWSKYPKGKFTIKAFGYDASGDHPLLGVIDYVNK